MLIGSAEGRTGESRENSFGFTTVVVVAAAAAALLEAAPFEAAAAAVAGVTRMVCVTGFGFLSRLCGCFG